MPVVITKPMPSRVKRNTAICSAGLRLNKQYKPNHHTTLKY